MDPEVPFDEERTQKDIDALTRKWGNAFRTPKPILEAVLVKNGVSLPTGEKFIKKNIIAAVDRWVNNIFCSFPCVC